MNKYIKEEKDIKGIANKINIVLNNDGEVSIDVLLNNSDKINNIIIWQQKELLVALLPTW